MDTKWDGSSDFMEQPDEGACPSCGNECPDGKCNKCGLCVRCG